MTTKPRYEGLAAWYDDFARSSPVTDAALAALPALVGKGVGTCLDIGCGTGVAFAPLADLGWSVVGLDVSADQLRVAEARARGLGARVELGDAAHLPFPDASFDAAVSVLTHTDFDDPPAVFREAARVVRPGGRLAYVGVHPCFVGPMTGRRGKEPPTLAAGYRRSGWWTLPAGPGVRARVGAHHLPLALLLNGMIEGGWVIENVEEPGGDDYPLLLGVAARPARRAAERETRGCASVRRRRGRDLRRISAPKHRDA